jgi:hypothetical protein
MRPPHCLKANNTQKAGLAVRSALSISIDVHTQESNILLSSFRSLLTLGSFAERDLHQLTRHFVKLRLKVLIVAGKSLPEGRHVH